MTIRRICECFTIGKTIEQRRVPDPLPTLGETIAVLLTSCRGYRYTRFEINRKSAKSSGLAVLALGVFSAKEDKINLNPSRLGTVSSRGNSRLSSVGNNRRSVAVSALLQGS